MRSSEITKAKVLKEATSLFNTKGYKSTSLSDITDATGLTKGAIYRHFENKECLEIEAFQKMMQAIFVALNEKIKAQNNTRDKLFCVLNLFQSYITNPLIIGGCPLLNVSVEVDDTNLELKQKAQQALTVFRDSVERIIINGKTHKQVGALVNEKLVATIMISTLEGGVMMSKLQNSNSDIEIVVNHLKNWIVSDILL
ncbi:TetR/AcrR family transcriptional regulator [Flavobacterium facile]|uniref:TetR/AcrR family transcriptional regulator n=1 Tax=Flavobacterium facile TaxID=2893174 RepID=UPI002E76C80F|nr:TetR/AcrR family transcriptional regulator [Flavobacterium sp. T-12]